MSLKNIDWHDILVTCLLFGGLILGAYLLMAWEDVREEEKQKRQEDFCGSFFEKYSSEHEECFDKLMNDGF